MRTKFPLRFDNRRFLISITLVVVLTLALISTLALDYRTNSRKQTSRTSDLESTLGSSSLHSASMFSSSSTTAITTSGFSINPADCGGNCTIDVPWTSAYHQYQNFTDLAADSDGVLLANVTAEKTILSDGIPITEYNITTIEDVLGNTVKPGVVIPVDQVGGTAGGVTMNINGDSPLKIGWSYILFLSLPGGKIIPVNQGNGTVTASESTTVVNGTTITFTNSATGSYRHSAADPFAQYILPVDDNDAQMTVGGPQGIFYVQGGNVYSLDNAFPQADAWLPLKVSGVPLGQFIQEVQSATATTSSTSNNG